MSGFDFGNLLSIARCLFLIMVSIIARCLLSIALMVSIIISIFFFESVVLDRCLFLI